MKRIAFLFFIATFLSCEGPKPRAKPAKELDQNVPPAYVSIDTSDGTQFRAIIKEVENNTSLSEYEIQLVDKILEVQIEAHNRKSDKSLLIDLAKYKRQYFATIQPNGDKKVEVNCFCQVHNNDDWKVWRIQVDDGGTCYFNLTVNLKTKRIISFHINGEA